MKALILVAVLGFAGNAHALMTCIDMQSVDKSYAVELTDVRDKATVKEITFAGAKEVASVPCSAIAQDPLKATPGTDTLKCERTDMVDNGFTITIASPNCAGDVKAKIEEHTIAGTKTVGNLICIDLIVD